MSRDNGKGRQQTAGLKVDGPVDVGKLPVLGAAEKIADQPGDGQARRGTKAVKKLFVLFGDGGMNIPIAGLLHSGPLRPHLLGLVSVLSGAAGAAFAFVQTLSPPGLFSLSLGGGRLKNGVVKYILRN